MKGLSKGLLGVIIIPSVAACSLIRRTGITLLQTIGGNETDINADERLIKKPTPLLILVLSEPDT